ncbi:uncharacterized protein [Nicotiana tomentosiformis]|uniref:uncharacterized protein n=1 Tax=Nicotiana tomentosiformis TaxID=4098 RepID=UPI00388C8600
MFFNGAANFKGEGIGAVLVSKIGQHYLVSAKLRFPYTNNMAKYEACILGLRLAIDMNVQELLVIGDSDLLVHQVLGEWDTKNTKILPYMYCIRELIKRFTKIEFKHIPRIQNEFADALVTLSSMIQHPDKNFIDPIPIGIHKQPAYCAHVEEESDGNPWFHDIKEYLKNKVTAKKLDKITLDELVGNLKANEMKKLEIKRDDSKRDKGLVLRNLKKLHLMKKKHTGEKGEVPAKQMLKKNET